MVLSFSASTKIVGFLLKKLTRQLLQLQIDRSCIQSNRHVKEKEKLHGVEEGKR